MASQKEHRQEASHGKTNHKERPGTVFSNNKLLREKAWDPLSLSNAAFPGTHTTSYLISPLKRAPALNVHTLGTTLSVYELLGDIQTI